MIKSKQWKSCILSCDIRKSQMDFAYVGFGARGMQKSCRGFMSYWSYDFNSVITHSRIFGGELNV